MQRSENFLYKSQIVNISGFAGYIRSCCIYYFVFSFFNTLKKKCETHSLLTGCTKTGHKLDLVHGP